MTFEQLLIQLNQAGMQARMVNGRLAVTGGDSHQRTELQDALLEHEQRLQELLRGGRGGVARTSAPVEEQSHYPLSHAQRRLWILHQLQGSEAAYNIPFAYLIEGMLDMGRFEGAFRQLVARHESLRTTFITVGGEPRQQIQPANAAAFRLDYRDLRQHPEKDRLAEELAVAEANRVFDLGSGNLFRVVVLHLEDERYLLLLTLHHIICDGWSMEVLIKEFLVLYEAGLKARPPQLPRLVQQYKDYALWQKSFLEGPDSRPHRNYWLQQFAGPLPVNDLPADFIRPPVMNSQAEKVAVLLEEELVERLRAISIEANASLFMVFLAIVKIVLYRYTGMRDQTIGLPIAGRSEEVLEGQIGFYVNTLAVRSRIVSGETFLSLVDKIRFGTLDAYEYQAYPFDLLVDELGVERDMSRSPLFDVMVDMEEAEFTGQGAVEFPGFRVRSFENGYKVAKFDLSISFSYATDGLAMSVTYNKTLFKRDRIDRMTGHFLELAWSVADSPDSPIAGLSIASPYESELTGNIFPANVGRYKDEIVSLPWFAQLPPALTGGDWKLHILDEDSRPQLTGINGRLHIETSQGLFPTTQLARWLPDGGIEYRGAITDILSFGNYRIESYEISRLLQRHEAVKEAAIIVSQDGNERRLIAFYTAEHLLADEDLINYLGALLPAYMVPARYIRLDRIPLDAHGRVDRVVLSGSIPALSSAESFRAPATDAERHIAEIWEAVLGRTPISVTDNFFRISGNSIKATQIVARMHRSGYKVTIRNIFSCPTIRQLAALLAETAPVAPETIPEAV